MEINEKINGFTVKRVCDCSHGRFIEMAHDKTAARLVWLDNKEENKLFSITFKTIPWDDTGVFHILEHSVLGGSEKYPVKEPFLYMVKSSMNTFLNAMTFPDKTMFPVSSRNHRDFMNLTKVYLDAVFKPLIYTVPDIFYQEGHHIEWLGNDKEAPVYKGVVFNEMKGVYSSVHERIECEMTSLLFPESCYRFEYGGDPVSVPKLTYEDFIAAHKKFYHPSNSYIYLDGDVNIGEVLELLDSYLSEYSRSFDLPETEFQDHIEPCVKEVEYEITSEENDVPQVHLAIGKIAALWKEREKIMAISVLSEALTGSNDAPLKRTILDTGLCIDVSIGLSDNIYQPYAMLKILNIRREDGEKILEYTENAVRDLVKNGIGRKTLEAALNRCEFRYKESEEPVGLSRCIESMSSWLYGGDPLDYIEFGEVFDFLREKLDSGYFEQILAELFLEKKGRAVLYMMPSTTYGTKQAENERKRLEAALSGMDDSQKKQLVRLNEKLIEWQNTPDTEENVASLPELPLSEVSPEPPVFETEEAEYEGVKILFHPAKNNDIIYINLYFSVSDLTKHELEILTVLDRLIAELPTEKSSGIEMQQKIIGILGDLNTYIMAYGKASSPEKCRAFFKVRFKFLAHNAIAAQELICEILNETLYENKDLISELLKQDEEDLKQSIISSGTQTAVKRVRAGYSAESAFSEFINGFESYKYLKALNEELESRFSDVIKEVRELAKRIFCRSRLIVSVTASDKFYPEKLLKGLNVGEAPAVEEMGFSLDIPEYQGIIIPSGVSYTGAVLPNQAGEKAVWNVLSGIISYEYLWNEVRVKGGAYGTGFGVNDKMEAVFSSYRDPSPARSIDIFGKAADFVRSFCEKKPDISSFIISSIASGEPLFSDGEKGSAADSFYFRGTTWEERKALRKRTLELTWNDMLSAVPLLEKNVGYCIVGPEEAVRSSGCDDIVIEVIS